MYQSFFKKWERPVGSLLFVSILSTVFLSALLLSFSVKPQKAYAICTPPIPTPVINPLAVPVNDVGNLVANSTTATTNTSLFAKECILDGIVNLIAKQLIKSLTASIVNWINSGFKGGPSFVTDPEQFFADTAGNIVGEYVSGTALGFVCDPFKFNIQLAFRLNYSSTRYKGCTLSQIVKNVNGSIDNFIGGNFAAGGWDGWKAMTTQSGNNPYGSYLDASADAAIRIQGKHNIDLVKLNWGKGFLSSEECVVYSADSNDVDKNGNHKCLKTKINTPGTVIEGQLEHALGSDLRSLELADEVDEIVGALVGQLVKQVITSVGGLAGASSGSGGSSSVSNNFNIPKVIFYPSNNAGFPGEEIFVSGFGFEPNLNTVNFKSGTRIVAALRNIPSIDGTDFSFIVPSIPAGRYSVTVANRQGTSNVVTFAVGATTTPLKPAQQTP